MVDTHPPACDDVTLVREQCDIEYFCVTCAPDGYVLAPDFHASRSVRAMLVSLAARRAIPMGVSFCVNRRRAGIIWWRG
jgi:hypothetical protein